MREIYNALKSCWEEGKRSILATIIKVEGSAYQREGARCLLLESGEVIGMISGGCVEGDLLEHAKDVILSHTPKTVVYDFNGDEDDLWGLGVGCNGVITVWLEPFDPIKQKEKTKQILDEIEARLHCNQPYYFFMCIESSEPDKIEVGQYLSTFHQKQKKNCFNGSMKAGIIETVIEGGKVRGFVELVNPLPSLLIVGAGPDAALLARRAHDLNWRVNVMDHRKQNLTSLFPEVNHLLIKRGNYSSLNLPTNPYIVIMTHNLELDYLALQTFIQCNFCYIGVLGSHQRMRKLVGLLKESLHGIDQDKMAKIHSPIGLDIGAQGPEEITVSIMSELIAVKNGRAGGSLSRLWI